MKEEPKKYPQFIYERLMSPEELLVAADKLYPVNSIIHIIDGYIKYPLNQFVWEYYAPSQFIRRSGNKPQVVDNGQDSTPQSLVGCKIDLRNEDGSVNSELSAAFQEACFSQGLTWISTCLRFPAKPNTPRFTDRLFLYTDDRYMKYGIDAKDFLESGNKEVKFEFERKLNWSVKYMTNETTRKIVEIGGVSYYEDKLLEAVQLLEAAKVVGGGVATPTAGGGVPPDRPLNMQ